MAIYGYTKNYKLIKPQFNTDTWHDYIYDNLDTIDAVMSAIYASGNWKGFWATNTVYTVGDVIIDQSTDTMYKVMVDHTTSEATFAEEFAAHPTYYELWSPNNLAEDWAIKMDDVVSNTDYSSKAYAISSGLIDAGSAKEWAIGSGEVGDTGEYSAKKYATDAHNDYISMTTDVNVIAVGTNIANVNAVGQSISNVNTVASDISSVNTVAGISTDVTTVASIATAVSNVSGIESEVLDVSDNRTDISTVASNISDINTVADVSADISTVAAIDSDVSTVATDIANVGTVAADIANVNAVAGDLTNIDTVASDTTNIDTVATNVSDVNTAATNMTAIQAAPTAASNAAASAILAQDWASKMDGQVASTDYSSKYYAGQAATDASNSNIWAEGTDEQVQALGGTHSSKVWAEQSTNANIALTNSPYTTNRILEIPQDIKLELSNGTLTLKAGSEVYVPNGFESDGVTPKFDIKTIQSDYSLNYGAGRKNCTVVVDEADRLQWAPFEQVGSGTSPTTEGIYYNTSTNTITSPAGWFSEKTSLPIAIVTENAGSGIGYGVKSIDQIFNGFGYIGSTVFVLPGVKVQIPNGRNEDGTYNYLLKETTSVIRTSVSGSGLNQYIMINSNGNMAGPTNKVKYDSELNSYIYTHDNSKQSWCIFAGLDFESGRITSFEPYTVDSVANSNASNFSSAGRSFIVSLPAIGSEVSSWTVGATGSTYTASKTGWLVYEHTGLNFLLYIDNKKVEQFSYNSQVVTVYTVRSVYMEKGSTVKINYDGTLNSLTFYNAKGEE